MATPPDSGERGSFRSIPLHADGIPAELRALPRWVAWQFKAPEKANGKPGKVPINAATGEFASSTDPTTWTSFDEAVAHASANRLPGVGFMLEGSGYTGFDWDGCRDPESGEIDAGALADIGLLQSYSEVSPSGTGLRAIAKGKLPPGRRRLGGVEMYDSGRFLTFTGACLEDFPATVEERSDEIALLHARHFGVEGTKKQATKQPVSTASHLGDDELIERATAAANGPKFTALMRGEWEGLYGSQSEAELALVSLIAFWTGPDPERIGRIFRGSGLMRDKWISSRGASTYGRITIDTALASRTEYYRGKEATPAAGTTPGSDAGTPHLTDTGNAERLVRRYGKDLRYCYPWKKWLVFDGKRWAIDQGGRLMSLSKEVVAGIYVEASLEEDFKKRDEIVKFARGSQRAERRKAMVELSQSEAEIPIQPGKLDGDPWLFNCANGTLDLRTFELRPHRQADFLTKLCPTKYVRGAACPTWLATLERVLPEDEVRGYFKRYCGYALTGDVSEQAVLWAIGCGLNGKSTLFVAYQYAVSGAYVLQIPTELLLAKSQGNHPTELADLFGMRLAIGTETPKGRAIDERLLKVLTGGEQIRARRMREDFWEFEPTHKLVVVSNHMPNISVDDFAVTRRLHLVRFDVRIPKTEIDRKLAQKLRAEREGILAWAVEGCREWHEHGLDAPEEVQFKPQSDPRPKHPVEKWAEHHLLRVPGSKVGATVLYEAFVAWCRLNNQPVIGRIDFGVFLGREGFGKKKSHGTYLYLDAALIELAEGSGDKGGRGGPPPGLISLETRHEEVNREHGPQGPHSSPEALESGEAATGERVPNPCAERICYGCRRARFWRLREGTHWVCGTCTPPSEDLADVVWNDEKLAGAAHA